VKIKITLEINILDENSDDLLGDVDGACNDAVIDAFTAASMMRVSVTNQIVSPGR